MKRILLVDDDPSLARLMAQSLGGQGYEVTIAGGLAEARTHQGPWALVIADVRLPNGDGRHLREDWPDTPFLIISGAPIDDPPGMGRFLQKPFLPARLRDVVRDLLRP